MIDDKDPTAKLDELAHELARLPRPRVSVPLTDAQLRACLDGMGEPDIEARLAVDDEARQRLAELAGLAPTAPPSAVRTRVLGQSEHRPRSAWPARIAAAVAVTALGLAIWLNNASAPSGAEQSAFTELEYTTSVQGLAKVRGAAQAGDTPVAYPDSLVTIDVTPQVSTALPVRYHLFVGRPPDLQPLQPVSVHTTRGATTLKFRPNQLADLQAGPLHLQVVLSLHDIADGRPFVAMRDKVFDYDLLVLDRDDSQP